MPSSPSPSSPSTAPEDPLLPATYDEKDLRAAVGASPMPASEPGVKDRKRRARTAGREDEDDDDLPRRPRNRTAVAVLALALVGGLAIAGLVFLGRANSERYFLACETERAVPQQGRGFPPWGTRALDGEPWHPLKIAAETRCRPHETDDPLDLQRVYLAMILEQATTLLTAHEVTKLDEAEALLKQGLLLTRPAEHESEKLATERNEQHKNIERMLGDVTYGRASAKLRDAATAITEAAKQFDSAAEQHPLHVSNAPAWATYARKLADEIHAGPGGTATAPAPASPGPAPAASDHPGAPAGVVFPVEPARPGASDRSAGAPDAGVPTGGVLL
jgi:hypothetical protein